MELKEKEIFYFSIFLKRRQCKVSILFLWRVQEQLEHGLFPALST